MHFSWFTLLPLLAAAFYALAMVLTRSKCQQEAPRTLALALHSSFLVTGLIAAVVLTLIGFRTNTKVAFPCTLSAACFVSVARAYQIAAPPIIATFDYAFLVSAAL
jgi:hypothetical protein